GPADVVFIVWPELVAAEAGVKRPGAVPDVVPQSAVLRHLRRGAAGRGCRGADLVASPRLARGARPPRVTADVSRPRPARPRRRNRLRPYRPAQGAVKSRYLATTRVLNRSAFTIGRTDRHRRQID